MTTADILTLSRLGATPVVVWLAMGTPAQRYSAMYLFIAATLTDVFDGYLARKQGPTVLGNYLDPVADKVLILSVFFTVSFQGALPLWMALVLLAREFVVSGVRDVAAARGKIVGANWMGKLKTLLQIITICWAIFALARKGNDLTAFRSTMEYTMLWSLAFFTTALSAIFAGIFVYWNRDILLAGRGAK
jgi:CDP-diacylglycerol--glycerol-3-phosphate 3-phosphatidyltransferase